MDGDRKKEGVVMKQKLLFVIESLNCAGAEKSLTTLLNLIDYSKYEVDLQLFSIAGEFLELVPEEVNILPKLDYFEYCNLSMSQCIKSVFSFTKLKMLLSRIHYSIRIRIKKGNNADKAVMFWKCCEHSFDKMPKEYDVAIAYAQGTPTFYVADKVKAKKKMAWVNTVYRPQGNTKEYNVKEYKKIQMINCVSDAVAEEFQKDFYQFRNHISIMYDIMDKNFILKMAKMKSNVMSDMQKGQYKLLTVGRLDPNKGYDIAIDAAKILRENGINFCWYVLGKGEEYQKIKELIKKNRLEEYFILLGVRSNPYPYILESDIYIQPSRFEGFGLAIAEARMLNRPVISTNFEAVYHQLTHEKNGLITDMNGNSVAGAIMRLIDNKELYQKIESNLKKEEKGNSDELKKFYKMLGE